MDNEFTVEGECNRCKGTGLYVGMAERDGFAVQCHGCKGTGCTTFRFAWNDFEKRKFLRGVSRVLRVNPGVVARVSSELGLTHLSFGGLAYG